MKKNPLTFIQRTILPFELFQTKIISNLWISGGQPWVFGLLNCFVHVLMYAYYFGSVYSPKLKTNLVIKRSITQLQIVRFIYIDTFKSYRNIFIIFIISFISISRKTNFFSFFFFKHVSLHLHQNI